MHNLTTYTLSRESLMLHWHAGVHAHVGTRSVSEAHPARSCHHNLLVKLVFDKLLTHITGLSVRRQPRLSSTLETVG
jgi:hypothetical protein